jgi:hypothetical protein
MDPKIDTRQFYAVLGVTMQQTVNLITRSPTFVVPPSRDRLLRQLQKVRLLCEQIQEELTDATG